MGGGSSAFAIAEWDGSGNPATKPRLEDIPENCIALVLARLDPTEICKLAGLNQAFRGASTADFIWEVKLPLNYGYIVDQLGDEKVGCLGKKDLYARLCRPNPFDGGTKVYLSLSLSLCVCIGYRWVCKA